MQTKNNTALAEAATVRNFYVISNNSITKASQNSTLTHFQYLGVRTTPLLKNGLRNLYQRN